MKRAWILLGVCVVQAALALALGLAGDMLLDALAVDAFVLVLVAFLVMVVLLVVNVRLLAPPRSREGDELMVFPLHWGTLFPLGVLIGAMAGYATVRLFSAGYVGGVAHTYEVIGLALGILIVLLTAFRHAPIPAAAFSLGYGVALPSLILFLDPINEVVITYEGHLGVMGVLAALSIIFGRYVRIKLVD